MKDSVRFHLIQSLSRSHRPLCERYQNDDDGMTLLELMVVIVIIGLLSLMALPYALKYTNQARESEAINFVTAVNRAQQAHYLEHNDFTDLTSLHIGVPVATTNYTYSSSRNDDADLISADTLAEPTGTMRGFAGRAWIDISPGSSHIRTIICEGGAASTPVIEETTCP